ncbi:MAG: Crp/Fnr family transcriptional regulator [Kofleriaceae bacterium]|nr:Crp/Fnr family transcriptional regulator [Myxococcales bacterium]MCB9561985.1 Crp/Fnr family transcriptional regulator [Kofleriaceae bacterium]MCB9573153.1 Crp/Fnr family transcriptional regulator [Kofleriaceae bacterium]
MPASDDRITSCCSCPCGSAAGVRYGGRCPLIDRKRRRDEAICLEGEPAHTVWFVKRGAVLLSRSGADGVERPRAVRSAGTFVGLEALVQGTYADSVRATEPTVLCGATRDTIDTWLGPVGTPARMALEQVLRATTHDAPRGAGVDGSATQRVARWLLDDQDGESAHVSRQVLASLLGMVPETLSRALARLRDDGAIDLTRTSVTVKDWARLEAEAR